MIALDTNVLVYAHRRDSEWHDRAANVVRSLVEGKAPWALPWPCLVEFFAVVTRPQIYDPPTKPARALDQIAAWLDSPTVVPLAESGETWPLLRRLVVDARVRGAGVHDARIAAVCLTHGVRELWSADRDFSRYPSLRTRNPLTDSNALYT